MGAAEQRGKDSAMASHLVKSGYPHGRRMSSPHRNSGGMTLDKGPGSANYQRLMERKK